MVHNLPFLGKGEKKEHTKLKHKCERYDESDETFPLIEVSLLLSGVFHIGQHIR